MKRNLTLMLLLSSLFGCAESHNYTMIPINKMPKGKQIGHTKRFIGTIATADSTGRKIAVKRTNRIFHVVDIGFTEDADGNLVGKHQLYVLTDDPSWLEKAKPAPESSKPKLPIPFKKKEPPVNVTQSPTPQVPSVPATVSIDQTNATANGTPDQQSPVQDILNKYMPIQPAPDFSIGAPNKQPDQKALDEATPKAP